MRFFGGGGGALFLLAMGTLFNPDPVSPQVPVEPEEIRQTVRLYLDCSAGGCYDLDFLRTEIPFVNWVRDIRDSDVYLLVTSMRTGAGGSSAELVFTGRGPYENMADTLIYVSAFDATEYERREGMAGMIKIGLMRYIGLTHIARDIEIGLRRREVGPGGATPVMDPEDDPWNFWVFRVRGSGGMNGRTNYRTRRFSGSFSAARTTETWKASLSISSSYNDTRREYEELDYYNLSIRRSHTLSGSLVRSINPNWSFGLRGSARNATYYNFNFAGSVAPVVEYSVFGYEEATRRSLTLQYAVEAVHHDYRERTIFFKDSESFVTQSLSGSLAFTRPWGTAFAAMEGAHHLTDVDLHHLSIFGGFSIRLGRGLSLGVHGDASRVRDLISVAAGADASIEEILLMRRQFQTDYTYSMSLSLSYSFGSVFNNIVNPRMGGGGIGIPIMIGY
jgi:hypothetical protein